MLITKPMPAVTFSLFDPIDGTWEFTNDPQRLFDGRPREKCRIAGADPFAAPQIQLDFSTPYTPVLFGVLARTATVASSPGFAMQGRPTGSDDFSVALTGAGAALYVLPDGTTTGLFLSTNTTELDAIRVSPGPIDSTFLDIGQLIAAECFEFRATRDWSEQRENFRKINTTQSGQPYPSGANISGRSASVTVAPVGFDQTIAGGDSLQALQMSLAGYRPACCVPMLREIGISDFEAIDQEAVTRSALFGYCDSLGTIQIVQQSTLFQLPLRFKEAPG